MKQLIILFYLLLSLSKISIAQYIPTAVDSAVWKIACSYNFLTNEFDYLTVQYTDGDTIINNVQYYKVYEIYKGNTPPKLTMLIRDNEFTNTVHAIYLDLDPTSSPCTPFIDVVLFDFNPFITSGTSSANCFSTYNIYSIDTTNLYGKDRRIFESDFGSFIEGIGNNTTGLNPGNSSQCTLMDYCRGTPEDCGAYAWVNTKDIRTYQQGKLYPNPARTQSRLELKSYLDNGKIQVFNLLGQLQQEQYFNGQEATLDVSQLSEGMYMIQVFENEQLVFGEKLFVIE